MRKDKELSQQQVAEVISVSQRTYSDYENGKLRLSIEDAVQLAKFYDVSVDYISGASDIVGIFPVK